MNPKVTSSDISIVKRAIKNLKNPDGSTLKNIFGQIVSDLLVKNKFPDPRSIQTATEIALRCGVQRGIFHKEKGKFKLVTKQTRNVIETKRRRKRSPSKKRRKPRSRKRTLFSRMILDDNNSESSACNTDDVNQDVNPINIPVDKTRRRGRRRRRGKSKSRSRSRINKYDTANNDNNEDDNKDCSDEQHMPDNKTSASRRSSRHSCQK